MGLVVPQRAQGVRPRLVMPRAGHKVAGSFAPVESGAAVPPAPTRHRSASKRIEARPILIGRLAAAVDFAADYFVAAAYLAVDYFERDYFCCT